MALHTTLVTLGLTGLLLTTAPVFGAEAISKRAGCAVCHAVETKGLGPSYRDIAAKHKGNAGAAALLEQRVRKGSVGVWGQLPMVATGPAQINDADLKSLVAWILTQAK